MALLDRQINILEYLKDKNRYVKGSELANILGVTDRTIRNDIIAIKDSYGEDIIEAIRTKGYKYNDTIIGENKPVDYTADIIAPLDRMLYILKSLLVDNGEINIYDLSEELYVSERTIESDINRIKNILSELDLKDISMERHGENIILVGYETYYSNILYDIGKYEVPELQLSHMQKVFSNINLDYLASLIIEILNGVDYRSRYLSVTKFILEVALMIESEYVHGFSNKSRFKGFDIKDVDQTWHENMNLAFKIKAVIKDKLGVEIKEPDIKFLAYNLWVNHKMNSLEDEIRSSEILDDELYYFCLELTSKLKEEVGMDIRVNKDLFRDFVIHIKIAMERVRLGIKLENDMREYLKNKYVYLINAAIFISKEIEKKYKLIFDFNEISYIAAYLAISDNDAKISSMKKSKIKIFLYVPEGIASRALIEEQIKKLGGNSIELVSTSNLSINTDLTKILVDYDLIISTSKRLNVKDEKIVVVKKNFLSIEKSKIKEFIDKAFLHKEILKFKKVCNEYLDAELFIKELNVKNKEEVIDKLCKVLKDNGRIDEEFIHRVLKREEIVSTELDSGIALPHSIKKDALKNGLAIAILKNPIIWASKKVRVVIMISFSTEYSEYSNRFMNFFVESVQEVDFIESIRRCNDIEEVKNIFNKYFVERIKLN